MKTHLFSRRPWPWLCAAALTFTGCATVDRPLSANALAVKVETPSVFDIIAEDRISEAFVDRVREVSHRRGLDLSVEEADALNQPVDAPYLLSVSLKDWRMTPTGRIECTFSGRLRTPAGTHELGLYTHSAMRGFGGSGRYGLARSYEEAADGAIDQLLRNLEQRQLLPLQPDRRAA